MKLQSIITFFILLGLFCSCQPNKKVKNSEELDFTPKESKYLNHPPNCLSYTMNYDGNSFDLIKSSRGSAKLEKFDLRNHQMQIQNGEETAFAYQILDATGLVIYTDIVSVATKLRANYPSEDESTILHKESNMDQLRFPVLLDLNSFSENNPPSEILISELELLDGKLIPVRKTKGNSSRININQEKK